MSTTTIGAGSYRTDLPAGELPPTDLNGQPISPLVTDGITGPVPTNDWASSLSFAHLGNEHSGVMHAHPLSMQAEAGGLALGYRATPRFIDGGAFDVASEGVKYEYTYAADIKVGLDGLDAPDTRLDGHGDWTVRAAWDDAGAGGLKATFGHGLPFVYFQREGDADAVIRLEQQESGGVGEPTQPLVYQLDGLNGSYDPSQATRFQLPVDAGGSIADGAQLRISYDFDGDGSFERIETFNYYPTDAVGGWELYDQGQGLMRESGSFADFTDGSVKLEFWNAIGEGDIAVRTDTPPGDPFSSQVELPFTGGNAGETLYLQGGAEVGVTVGTLSPAAGSSASSDSTAVPEGAGLAGYDGPGSIWHQEGGVVGLTINGTHYGIFGPSDATWSFTDEGLSSDLAGHDRFSVAVLPDDDPATLELFRTHAYAHVTGSRMTYEMDPGTGEVVSRFELETEMAETGADLSSDPLMALYRHQYINSDVGTLEGGTYASARGELRLIDGGSFETRMQASPILPGLPATGALDEDALGALLDDEAAIVAARDGFPQLDTYWVGKELARLGELAHIAGQLGREEQQTQFLDAMKAELEDWLTADGAEGDKQFYYNEEWGTLQGYPASFHSETQINDHHFHYGYFVEAAATIAELDPEWATEGNWGGMIEQLIRDVASPDREDALYPWLRSFDPYAGHGWASGHGGFSSGNNQESSSESLNFSWSLARWGAATGNQELADLGLFLHTVESEAVRQYWFDADDAVFPDGYNYGAVGMVWGDGGDHRTFFSGAPEMIRGINFLPINGSSLRLGWDPEEILRSYQEIVEIRGGDPAYWKDLIWQYRALADADAAVAAFEADPGYTPEAGASVAHTYHWLYTMQALGRIAPEITASSPYAAAFTKDGETSYVAYNPTGGEVTVTFSDGASLTLPGRSMTTLRADGETVTTLMPGSTGEGTGEVGDDTLTGGEGNDTLNGGDDGDEASGSDTLALYGDHIGFADTGSRLTLESTGAYAANAPLEQQSFTISGLTGSYSGGGSAVSATLDAGTSIGDATQLRLSYDFDGDGVTDRLETFAIFPTDPVPGDESFTGQLFAAEGAFQDFDGGSVTAEIWRAFGGGTVTLDQAATRFEIPYADLIQTGVEPGDDTLPGDDTQPGDDTGSGGDDTGSGGDDTSSGGGDTASGGNVTGDGLVRDGDRLLFTEAGPLTIDAADGDAVFAPEGGLAFSLDGLTGAYQAEMGAAFALQLDAGTGVGNGTAIRIGYDFDGDGSADRTETYQYFATDAVQGWQSYGQGSGLIGLEGDWADFDDGSVQVNIWNAIGGDPVSLDTGESWLDLPFDWSALGGGSAGDSGGDSGGSSGGTGTAAPDVLMLGTDSLIAGDGMASAGSLEIGPAGSSPVVLEATGLTGSYTGGAIGFDLPLDAGNSVANGTHIRVSIDHEGDGSFDRIETFQYFPTNDIPDFETYDESRGHLEITGAHGDLTGGTVRVELWNAIGTAAVTVDLDDGDGIGAKLTLPYEATLI